MIKVNKYDKAVDILIEFFEKFPLQYVQVMTMPPHEYFKHYLWLRGYEMKPIDKD